MNSQFVKHFQLFYVIAIACMIIGILGICLGLWVQFYRLSSPGELMINRSLLFYSFGFLVIGYLFLSALKTIRQLNANIQSQKNV